MSWKPSRVILAVISALVVLLCVFAALTQAWAQSKIVSLPPLSELSTDLDPQPTPTPPPSPSTPASPGPSASSSPAPPSPSPSDEPVYQDINFLLLGADAAASEGALSRADSTMLIHLYDNRTKARVLSIPRDLWVPLPGCAGGQPGRFNQAYYLGGPNCALRAVKDLTGLKVNHLAVADFKGFRRLVDAVGGVTVCFPHAIDDPHSGLKVPAGEVTLTPVQALALARARYTLGDGSDISRSSRQAVLARALMRSIFADLSPGRVYSLVDAALANVSLDESLSSPSALSSFALSLTSLEPSKVQFRTYPWVARSDGATVAPDTARAAAAIDFLLGGKASSLPPSSVASQDVKLCD